MNCPKPRTKAATRLVLHTVLGRQQVLIPYPIKIPVWYLIYVYIYNILVYIMISMYIFIWTIIPIWEMGHFQVTVFPEVLAKLPWHPGAARRFPTYGASLAVLGDRGYL